MIMRKLWLFILPFLASPITALAREDVEAALDTPGSNRSGSGPGTSTAPDAGAAPGTSATPGTDVLPGAGATLDTAPSDRGTTPSAGPVAGAAEASAGALTPPASPPDESTAWVVHLASFRELEDANVDIGRLRGKGIEARAVYVEVPERGPWYRVVAGSFASFVEARQRSLQLSRQLGLDQVHVISGGGQDVPVPIPIPKAGDAKAAAETLADAEAQARAELPGALGHINAIRRRLDQL